MRWDLPLRRKLSERITKFAVLDFLFTLLKGFVISNRYPS